MLYEYNQYDFEIHLFVLMKSHHSLLKILKIKCEIIFKKRRIKKNEKTTIDFI